MEIILNQFPLISKALATYTTVCPEFSLLTTEKVQFWEMLFGSLTKTQFMHEHIYLLESDKSFLGQEKIGCLSFKV